MIGAIFCSGPLTRGTGDGPHGSGVNMRYLRSARGEKVQALWANPLSCLSQAKGALAGWSTACSLLPAEQHNSDKPQCALRAPSTSPPQVLRRREFLPDHKVSGESDK
jgi:hypothetical protein